MSGESPKPIKITLDLRDRILDFSDEELLSRLKNFEDNFVERKRIGDSKDEWLQAAVAFANSVPVGYPAILFIGVKNTGEMEGGANLDTLQQTLSKVIDEAYPPIYYTTRIVLQDGKQCLAVIIPGSELRPHFAGHSYVRVGSQTKKASEEQFENLILQRSSKARELQKMIGKTIFWEMVGGIKGNANATMLACNQFFITVDGGTYQRCFPLEWITISFDPANQRYHLVVQHP